MKGVRGVQNLPDGKCADPPLSHSHIFFAPGPKKHGIIRQKAASQHKLYIEFRWLHSHQQGRAGIFPDYFSIEIFKAVRQ
jgi:hypothetical protein